MMGMQNARVVRLRRLLPRLQKKALVVTQFAPERAVYEAARVKLKVQWRPQKVGKARNI